ncbi:MAG: ceramidase domain-containing protein [Gemmatimonadetes bacterium]|nr:ceramidase domain-containing protein [Gemmatimonadota bacterium]
MIDLYCERTGPGLWAEPLNALTNLAYFAAAWAVWRIGRGTADPGARLLVGLLVAIGTGSALFHTFATPWARVLDVVPILLFQASFLWLYGRRIVGIAPAPLVGVLAGFLVAAYAGRQFPQLLNGSLMYAPAFLAALGVGLYHSGTQQRERLTILAAVGLFVAAVLSRTMDNLLCSSIPIGTHFLWHLLTASALYLFARGLLVSASSRRLGE